MTTRHEQRRHAVAERIASALERIADALEIAHGHRVQIETTGESDLTFLEEVATDIAADAVADRQDEQSL